MCLGGVSPGGGGGGVGGGGSGGGGAGGYGRFGELPLERRGPGGATAGKRGWGLGRLTQTLTLTLTLTQQTQQQQRSPDPSPSGRVGREGGAFRTFALSPLTALRAAERSLVGMFFSSRLSKSRWEDRNSNIRRPKDLKGEE